MKNISDAVTSIKAEINRLQGVLSHLEGDAVTAFNNNSLVKSTKKALGMTAPVKVKAAPAVKKSKRKRRSSDDVKAQAAEMAAFIKSKGKTGATGKEITAKFGPVLPSIKMFINDRVDAGSKIKSVGAASKTTYHG